MTTDYSGRARYETYTRAVRNVRLAVFVVALASGMVVAPQGSPSAAAVSPQERQPSQAAAPIRPDPAEAEADVPAPQFQGCMIGIEGIRSGPCVYGDPNGRRTLILFGDSHALQHFPALEVVAKRNRWRLVVLTKRECGPAEVEILNSLAGGEYSQCDAWRQSTLRRIEERGGHPVVAISGKSDYTAYGPRGEKLSGAANTDALEAGYVATLKRIQRAGLRPAVIRDTPKAPFDVPECVLANMEDPAACDFAEHDRWWRDFDLRAARRAGVPLIDPAERICPRGLCRAVMGDVLVYRDPAHLTATYARTLNSWFEPKLRRAFARLLGA